MCVLTTDCAFPMARPAAENEPFSAAVTKARNRSIVQFKVFPLSDIVFLFSIKMLMLTLIFYNKKDTVCPLNQNDAPLAKKGDAGSDETGAGNAIHIVSRHILVGFRHIAHYKGYRSLFMVKMLSILAPAFMLLLAGCNLAPDYQRPEMDMPQTWEASQSQALQTKWWERFHDETLNALVEEALAHNKNIDQAMANVDQAQAGLGIARDALLPVPSASAEGTRTMARSSTSPAAMQNNGKNTHTFSGALAASWTLDFWGKYWNAAESARATLVATEASRDNVILTVAASTVESYFWLSAYTWQEEIARDVLKNREDSLKIYQNRFDNGQISDLDILSIRANVETARNALASARIAKNAAETSLAVLLGRSPAEIDEDGRSRGSRLPHDFTGQDPGSAFRHSLPDSGASSRHTPGRSQSSGRQLRHRHSVSE